MARGVTHVVGLDIGNESLKLVELALTKGGVRLLSPPLLVPVPAGAVSGGVVADISGLAGALREALGGIRLGTRQAVLAVGGDTSVVSRVVSLPRMSGKELTEAMQFELDRQTPFPVDQVLYDYQPLPAAAEGENMEVFLAVAQEDVVNTEVDLLRAAKLTPAHIEVEPLALARSLVGLAGGKLMEQTVIVLDCGATFTGIYIFRQGWPVFLRTIPTAGNSLTDAIREHLSVDQTQAEQAKRAFADVTAMAYEAPPPAAETGGEEHYGALYDEPEEEVPAAPAAAPTAPAAPPAAAPAAPAPAAAPAAPDEPPEVQQARGLVNEAISQKVYDLITEITRSVDFYRRQHREETLAEIIVCGGSAHLRGLTTLLSVETGLPARVGNPFENLQTDGVVSAEYLREVGPNLAVAVGLALRDMLD